MELKNIIIHKLEKEPSGLPKIILSKKALPKNDTVESFINNVKNSYYKRSPNYGSFDEDIESYPFQTMVKDYLKNGNDIVKFSERAMKLLQKEINVQGATGGYVVFSHFVIPQGEFLISLMINDTERYSITEELALKALLSLEIEKLDVANFINISKWNDNEDTYLSFLRGRKEISNYFKKFIGCTDQTSSKEASKKLNQAIYSYLKNSGLDEESSNKIRNKIYEYCDSKIRKREEILIETISLIIDENNPEKFKDFACSEEFQVSSTITGNRDVLRNLRYISYKSKDLNIQFDQRLLRDKKIIYNKIKNELVIKEIPAELREKLEK